jgi:hypothetical protein
MQKFTLERWKSRSKPGRKCYAEGDPTVKPMWSMIGVTPLRAALDMAGTGNVHGLHIGLWWDAWQTSWAWAGGLARGVLADLPFLKPCEFVRLDLWQAHCCLSENEVIGILGQHVAKKTAADLGLVCKEVKVNALCESTN